MKNKILVIAAHPDDEVLGMGGTIAKCSEKGFEIALLIVTDGSSTQYKGKDVEKIIESKRLETNAAAEELGIGKIYYGNLPDMQLDTTPHTQINAVIENVLDDFKPDIVFTHFEGDVNKDHQRVYESTIVACRPLKDQCVKTLLSYSVPSSTEWNVRNTSGFFPNVYVDISGKYAESKYKAMNCYKTEMRDYPHPRSIEYLKTADLAEGLKVGAGPSESFILLRNVE